MEEGGCAGPVPLLGLPNLFVKEMRDGEFSYLHGRWSIYLHSQARPSRMVTALENWNLK